MVPKFRQEIRNLKRLILWDRYKAISTKGRTGEKDAFRGIVTTAGDELIKPENSVD